MSNAKTKRCSGCGEEYELGTNCKCGFLSVSDDAISVDEFEVLGCLDYHATSSDGSVSGFVCNNSNHEHCGKIVVITGVFKHQVLSGDE